MIQPALESASVDIDGSEVRRLRKGMCLNLQPFAERCGISPGYLSHIELMRRTKVSPQVFGQICEALGLDNKKKRAQIVRRPHKSKAVGE